MHTGLFLLYRCHVCTCADLLCPSVCAFLAFHALYGNRQSFHPRIQWACCRYDFRRSALLRDAKSALRIGALLYDRSGRAIECTGKGCEVINIYFFIFLYSINLRFYHQPERFINSHLNYFMLYFRRIIVRKSTRLWPSTVFNLPADIVHVYWFHLSVLLFGHAPHSPLSFAAIQFFWMIRLLSSIFKGYISP